MTHTHFRLAFTISHTHKNILCHHSVGPLGLIPVRLLPTVLLYGKNLIGRVIFINCIIYFVILCGLLNTKPQ